MGDRMKSSTDAQQSESAGGAINATGVYETADGIVLYDSENALAWVQAENALQLSEMA